MHRTVKKPRRSLFALSLNKKLIVLMLFLSISLSTILTFLYYQTERSIYSEFENYIA